MKTNEYPISNDALSVKIITDVVEDLSTKEKLSEKQCLQLRLLSEELFGMTNSILDVRDGKFYIEQNKKEFKLTMVAQAYINEKSKQDLMSVSTDGKNTYYKGVTGKILQAVDSIIYSGNDVTTMPHHVVIGYDMALQTRYQTWSLATYMQAEDQSQKADDWDGLERSILIKLADDVLVGVSGGKVKISVVKTFK